MLAAAAPLARARNVRANEKAHALGGCGVSTFAKQPTTMRVELLKSAPIAKSRAAVVSRAPNPIKPPVITFLIIMQLHSLVNGGMLAKTKSNANYLLGTAI